jgi:mxaK protein
MRGKKVIRTLRNAALWGVLLASSFAFFYESWALYRIERENAWMEQLASGHDIDIGKLAGAQPEVRLARAVYFKSKHRYDEALATLSLIMNAGDPALQAKIRYNLGNVYLEQAVEQTEAQHFNEALPLAGLAKQAYRQALALDSRFWDAKYNLEVAMRLLSEMDRINIEDDSPDMRKSQPWTTVPGFPRGQP